MSPVKLKWSSLLRISDLEFEPEPPKIVSVSDELQQSLSWLTGATNHDRRLLRCNENGALLITDAWANLNEVETDELFVQSSSPDTFTASVANKGVLISTGNAINKISFKRLSTSDVEIIYVPANSFYWFGHPTYSVVAAVVPDPGGTASYIGITAYN